MPTKFSLVKGTAIIFITAVSAALIVLILLLFCMGDGLAFDTRIHCSMRKVVVYSVGTLLSIAVQWLGYRYFFEKCRTHDNARVVTEWERTRTKLLIMFPTLTALLSFGIVSFLLTWFIDQNRNLFWLFINNYGSVNVIGIICASLLLVGSWLSGFISCKISF